MPTLSGSSKSVNPQSNFEELFHDYVSNGVQAALDRIDPDPNVPLSGEVRERVLHVLSYAMYSDLVAISPEIWSLIYKIVERLTPKIIHAGNWLAWIPYLQQGLKLSRFLHDVKSEANLSLWLGMLFERLGRYEDATQWLNLSLILFKSLKDRSNQAWALCWLAHIARLQRDIVTAKKWTNKAKMLFSADDPNREFCFYIKGTIALHQEHWPLAIKYLKKSININSQYKNERLVARRCIAIGLALMKNKDYQAAINCLQRALNIFAHIYDPIEEALARMNLGIVHVELNELEQALKLHIEAEPILLQSRNVLHLAMLYNNLGYIHGQFEQWDFAACNYFKSIKYWRDIGDIVSLSNVIDGLGVIYAKQKMYAKAVETFSEAIKLLSTEKDIPGYQRNLQMIQIHLQQVQEDLVET